MEKKVTKRKRKLKVGRILIALTILVVAVIGIYFLVTKLTNNNTNNNNVIAGDKNQGTEVKEETYKLSMVMVGDNLIHSSIYNEANRNANYDGYDFKPMITMIKDKVKGYDLAYYNQETILGGSELGLSDYPTFNSPFEAGDAMLDAGFNMVSLATNHTIDRGEKAVLNSCEYWNSKTDVLTAGSYCSEEERNEIKVMEKVHGKVGVKERIFILSATKRNGILFLIKMQKTSKCGLCWIVKVLPELINLILRLKMMKPPLGLMPSFLPEKILLNWVWRL